MSTLANRPTTFDGWWRVNGQITKKLGALDIYVGGENLTDFVQQDAVIGANDPFGPNFDASLVWGPLDTRLFYAGIRYTIE